jgi:pimeloyl-ACP methyl ester carboxylesterase
MRLTGAAAAGLAQLVLRGGKEITDVVAEMHGAIVGTPWAFLGVDLTRPPVAYRIVAGTFQALASLVPELSAEDAVAEPPGWRKFVGVLNGVLGDHLAGWGNPLATIAGLRDERGVPFALPAVGRVVVLVHGSCGSELDWQRPGFQAWVDERRAAGEAVAYFRYNSGLPIRSNAAALARILEAGQAELVLIGHSMGGLVIREAMASGAPWVERVRGAAYLASPHLGSPVERAGHFASVALGLSPYSAPLVRAANVRSQGVKDLRFGLATADGTASPLAPHVSHLFVAAILGPVDSLGDGLVPLASALAETLTGPTVHRVRVDGIDHLGLLGDDRLLAALRTWGQALP